MRFKNWTPGPCGNPYCEDPRAEGRLLCAVHAKDMDRIRAEMQDDPNRLYNKRINAKKAKRPPTCRIVGCFEIRESGKDYCFEHEDAA